MLLKIKDWCSNIDNFHCCRLLTAAQCWNLRPLYFTFTYFCHNKRFIGIFREEIFVTCWHYGFTSGPNGCVGRLSAALCCRGRCRDSCSVGCPRQDTPPPPCGRSFGCRLLARAVSAAAGRIARSGGGQGRGGVAASAVPLPPPSFWRAQGR